jgi:phosphoribosylformylglycinamidine (FGAM) synthase-like amidotransferase family enzyme
MPGWWAAWAAKAELGRALEKKIKTKKIETGLDCNGTQAEINFGPLRKNEKFSQFLYSNLNLKPRFESKSNTFSNSNNLKLFLKIVI